MKTSILKKIYGVAVEVLLNVVWLAMDAAAVFCLFAETERADALGLCLLLKIAGALLFVASIVVSQQTRLCKALGLKA